MRVIVPLTGQGSGIIVTATQSTGAINATNVTAGGTGYVPGSTVTFTVAGSGGGSGALLTGTIGSNGSLATGSGSLTITNAGSAYSGTITVSSAIPSLGGPATVTTTGAVQPTTGADISATTYTNIAASTLTWCTEVLSLTAGKNMAVALELSLNAFGASTLADVKQFTGQEGQGGATYVSGAFTPTTDKRSTVIRQQLPFSAETYFGVSGGVARINVTGIDGSAEATINSWLELG